MERPQLTLPAFQLFEALMHPVLHMVEAAVQGKVGTSSTLHMTGRDGKNFELVIALKKAGKTKKNAKVAKRPVGRPRKNA